MWWQANHTLSSFSTISITKINRGFIIAELRWLICGLTSKTMVYFSKGQEETTLVSFVKRYLSSHLKCSHIFIFYVLYIIFCSFFKQQSGKPNVTSGALRRGSRVPQCEWQWSSLPVERNSGHWIYRGEDSGYGEEVVESAVIESEIPLIVHGIDKVYNGVERWHWRFSERQVHKEIIRHSSHAFVRQNDPYHRNIAHHGDDDNCAVSHCPEHYPPNRLNELVPVYLCFILRGGVDCPVTWEVRGSDERIHSYWGKMVNAIVSWLYVLLAFNRPCSFYSKKSN